MSTRRPLGRALHRYDRDGALGNELSLALEQLRPISVVTHYANDKVQFELVVQDGYEPTQQPLLAECMILNTLELYARQLCASDKEIIAVLLDLFLGTGYNDKVGSE